MATNRRKLILPGGAGFLGQILASWFAGQGWEVVVLTRRPAKSDFGGRTVSWDGKSLGPWTAELEGAQAVINLAGRSVNCRYQARNRQQMLDSRVASTRVLGEAIAACRQPPRVWLNASTATIYKHTFDRPMDEATGIIGATPEAKDAFSIEVARAWEQAFAKAQTPATRKLALRMAMVFGTGAGGVYRVLRRLVRLGLGGSIAGGEQYVSWIHELDFCRSIEFLMEHDELSGPVNLAAPQPLSNREFMRLLRKSCGIPFGLPAARWMLEVGTFLLRTESELVIKSRRVVPTRLLEAGFKFRFPDFASAVNELSSRGNSRLALPNVVRVADPNVGSEQSDSPLRS